MSTDGTQTAAPPPWRPGTREYLPFWRDCLLAAMRYKHSHAAAWNEEREKALEELRQQYARLEELLGPDCD